MSSAPVGRFAPTPSGRLHLGNILCAMLAYLSVKSRDGVFLLRIEDLDAARCPRALSEQIIKDLQWLGFSWDEAPVYQSERSAVYQCFLDQLSRQQLVYPCFCTRAELHASTAPNLGDTQFVYAGTCAHLSKAEIAEKTKKRSPAARLKVPDRNVAFTDGLYGPVQENLARDCGDFIIRRSDGVFGYQLAVVVDDALSGVHEIVRGHDILSATPRQIYLQECLHFPRTTYYHIPLLTDWNGKRLSKRDRSLDLSALSKRFSPEELIGILAFACGITDRFESASLQELINIFSWEKIKTQDLKLPQILCE